MNRRSTKITAKSGTGESNPGTSKRLTRRQSLPNTAASKTSQSRKSIAVNNLKKLNEQDIEETLNSDDDDQYKNKTKGKPIYQCFPVGDHESIVVKIKRIDEEYLNDINEYKLGVNLEKNLETLEKQNFALEQPRKKHEADGNPEETAEKRILRSKSAINLNEDVLIQNIFNDFSKPKNSRKSVKSTDAKSPRKRLASSTKLYRDSKDNIAVSDSETDENSMSNANRTPKRSKSINDSMKTPSKAKSRTPAQNAVKSLKNFTDKSLLDSPTKKLKNLDLNPSTPKSKGSVKFNETHSRKALKANESKADSDEELYTKSISDFEESGDDDNDKSYVEESSSSDSGDSDTSIDSDKLRPKRKGMPKTPSKTPKKNLMESPTKSMAKMCLTPSMHQRTMNIVKPSTPLQEARLKLHVSVLPKSLPCREEQFNDIYTFLHARLSDKSGGCIYISGVPGTGKTATVNEVIRCLKKSMDAGKLTKFEFVDINGMKLSEPRQAYVQIWKQLTGQQTTWEEAHKLLQDRFSKSNSNRGMTLLLVDELDLLCTKRQDVVYNLLDWPTKTGAKLVVVTVANTMDLPERVFMGKVTSRLGLSRLTFPPYNHIQLEEIVISRLRGYNAFGGEAIQLVARKVAAVSGDARRALDICRRATEIAENNDRETVSIIDVKQAVDEMIASPKIQAIKHCSEMERMFLQAVCAEVHRTGVEEVVFKNVYMQLLPLCTLNGEVAPNVTESLTMCARLGAWRLLLCEHSRMDIHQRILLNVSTDDVQFAVKAIEV